MPNHIHGIAVIRDRTRQDAGVQPRVPPAGGADLRVRPTSLPQIVQWFKTMTTNAYIRGVGDRGWTPFAGRLWQRNYYEHIVRSEEELARIRDYIENNPLHWDGDPDNPAVTS